MTEGDTQRGDGELGTCHVCGDVFSTQEALIRHLEEAHEEDRLVEDQSEPVEADPSGV